MKAIRGKQSVSDPGDDQQSSYVQLIAVVSGSLPAWSATRKVQGRYGTTSRFIGPFEISSVREDAPVKRESQTA
jgi:hypothetical protein